MSVWRRPQPNTMKMPGTPNSEYRIQTARKPAATRVSVNTSACAGVFGDFHAATKKPGARNITFVGCA
jgi:hypothetical protein